MIEEAYVSFETAKLLKEKGFDKIECKNSTHFTYNADGQFSGPSWDSEYNAPTHQMAMAWLREVHGIYIVFFHTNKSGWWYNITDMRDSYVFYSSEKIMCSYEEVVDLAIKYTLVNLI